MHLRMNMFGLEGSGFIVSIGLTLLISGVVVYYCNTKIKMVEENLSKQNKILGEFISSVQSDLQLNHQNLTVSNDNSAAIESIIDGKLEPDMNNRIVVSDHSNSGSDSESDLSESDTDSNCSDVSNKEDASSSVDCKEIKNTLENSIKVIDVDASSNNGLSSNNLSKINEIHVTTVNNENDSESSLSSDDDDDDDGDHEDYNTNISNEVNSDIVSTQKNESSSDVMNINDVMNVNDVINVNKLATNSHTDNDNNNDNDKIDTNKIVKDITNEVVELTNTASKSYTQMKVAELRSIAISNNLADPSSVKNLKKNALISLLTAGSNKINTSIEQSSVQLAKT